MQTNNPNPPAAPLMVQIGSRRYSFTTYEAISAAYCAARDASGEGASIVPSAKVYDGNGNQVAHISYNGRVWPGAEWSPGIVPLYDPYA